MFLLAGTASAIEDIEDTDAVSTLVTVPSVSIAYNDTGPFKMGDVVKITATFSEPVIYAQVKVDNSVLAPVNMTNMTYIGNTDWSYSYNVPGGIDNSVDVTIYGFILGDYVEAIDPDAFVVDNEAPRIKIFEPSSTVYNTKDVVFDFGAFDKLDNIIDYAIYINGTQKKTGTINSNGYAKYETELDDGYYPWEITLEDDAGNKGTSGVNGTDLYVDTKAPSATLISPADLAVVSINNSLFAFNFTSQDDLSAKYNLPLSYQLYIDGESVGVIGSGNMLSGEYAEIPYVNQTDGAHNWSVYIEDMAGNSVTSEVRKFYVNFGGLDVSLISPNGGFVPANPEFNFSVSGGAGLPFDYELLINGTKVKNGTFIVGEDPINYYSVTATVEDATEIPWTVRITDCAGTVYEPIPLSFSVDTEAPAAVANLGVFDALSNTTWYYTYDEPGLYVGWDKNTEEDLYDGLDAYYGVPYVVFISASEPSNISEMELAVPVTTIYDAGNYMYMYIGEYGGEPLVYGKDYWVAVIALDRAGNYNENVSVFGPAQTYEDLTLTLDAGWNLKSVPKNLATFNAGVDSVFGESSTVIYWNGNSWEFPTIIEPCKGYWVYTPEADMRNVKFKPMSIDSTTPDVPPSLDLAPGWQMIGHTSTVPVHWAETLGSLQGLLGVEYKFSNIITYSQNEGWGGTISLGILDLAKGADPQYAYPVEALQSEGLMVPGQGYWIFMKEDGTYASIESVAIYNEPV
ncbi:hypothetical protein [Methanosarcina sp. 1.H.A.2.2]|uniref:hypothetical protein n=1 Tax=Methanosarcina sp. 1.H.A.2.2 TaxID=1483601 RepID=UPI0006227D8F|nr:hypothetical protein [Methanosarcina sp. 1.H.A.2.2]KKH46931.1 hypothetical protein EO93_06340 [Methanosarcina sp. 1.H.A.2.2]